jgi:hypothetical protein
MRHRHSHHLSFFLSFFLSFLSYNHHLSLSIFLLFMIIFTVSSVCSKIAMAGVPQMKLIDQTPSFSARFLLFLVCLVQWPPFGNATALPKILIFFSYQWDLWQKKKIIIIIILVLKYNKKLSLELCQILQLNV